MYSRRSANRGGALRWAFGFLTVLIAVGGFFVFQYFSALPPIQPGPVETPTVTFSTAKPAPTKKPTTRRIISEKAQLSTEVTQLFYSANSDNWDLTYLGALAGHLQGTPEMGKGGNFVLAGHVELKDGARGPFAQIHLLKAGDPITIISDEAPNATVMQYLVTDVKKVQPQDFGVMRNHGYEELTLITCDDWDQRVGAYATRVIVHARPSFAIRRLTQTAIAKTPTSVPGVPGAATSPATKTR